MKGRLDLSIGQRLALGFGGAGVLLALLLGIAATLSARIDAMRARNLTDVAPRTAAVDRLETAILYMAIDVRSYLLAPDDDHRAVYQRSLRRAREALDALERLPRGAEGQALFERIPGLLAGYEAAVGSLVADLGRTGAQHRPDLEAVMASARESLLSGVRDYGALLRGKAEQTQAEIVRAQDTMDRAIPTLGGLVFLLVLATGLATARGVRAPAMRLLAAARRLAAGEYGPALELSAAAPARHDELAELSHAFGAMARALKGREDRLQATGRVSAALASTLDLRAICEAALHEIVEDLGVEVGAVYLREDGESLRRRFALGLAGEDVLAPGEGLPGRALRSRKTVVSADLPADAPFTVGLGVDRLPPRTVVAAPMTLQDRQVVGVLVIASLRPIAPDAIAFLEQAATQLAVGVQNALGHERIRQLAAELQDQNERLQAQNEEIQAQREELQAQHEELQSQNEELQVQGEELRAQGDEQQRTQEALERADKNKNDFLAVLSHELRNPLAPIMNSLYVLGRAEPGSERAQRAVKVVERQVGQLTRLVEDLLDVTRISRGKVQLRRTGLDLAELVRQAAEDNRTNFAAHGVALQVETPTAPVSVDGDPARLAQIVGNILQNAVKFTPQGGQVRVALEADGGTARLRVRDTGAGMDGETLARLFQPFMQAEASLARTSGGLGLGLALVKGLVEMHGGTVRASSDGRGKGSEVVVELPIREGPAVAEAAPLARPRPGRRVLIIEDNVDAAESLKEALELAGHEVAVAYDGRAGVQKARAFRPEVILCDIGLPGLDGYGVARALRSDADLRAVRLVALTGYALPDDLRRAADAGFDRHLAKPPSFESLQDALAPAEAAAAG